MSTELERYKEAHTLLFQKLNEVASRRFIGEVFDEVNLILNPPPEYEEVEVVRWAIFTEKGDILADYANKEDGAQKWPEHAFVKLTGTLRRPKPQKVERSVNVSGMVANGGIVYHGTGSSKTFFDHPETHDKKGIITFTWIEEGDGR